MFTNEELTAIHRRTIEYQRLRAIELKKEEEALIKHFKELTIKPEQCAPVVYGFKYLTAKEKQEEAMVTRQLKSLSWGSDD